VVKAGEGGECSVEWDKPKPSALMSVFEKPLQSLFGGEGVDGLRLRVGWGGGCGWDGGGGGCGCGCGRERSYQIAFKTKPELETNLNHKTKSKGGGDDKCQDMVVVTIVVTTRGALDVPAVTNWSTLRRALQQVGG